MKKVTQILWGIALVILGVVIILNALDITKVNIFFDGWWTVFIILPCLFGLFSSKDITGNLIGLGIGVLLLLGAQNIISFSIIWKLAIPVIIVVIGLKMIFSTFRRTKTDRIVEKIVEADGKITEYAATFSGQDINYSGEEFTGVELTAVFGGIKCDLRNSIINEDAYIKATCIFGGVDILVPNGVNIKVASNSIFGGVSDKHGNNSKDNEVTIYVNATCIFGGTDIK